MTARQPPEYVLARSVLLDALQALAPHLDAVVLVGAQAVYLHTGDAELIVVPTTTDADLALFPAKLLDQPLLEDALRGAGFELAPDPGAWRGRFGVAPGSKYLRSTASLTTSRCVPSRDTSSVGEVGKRALAVVPDELGDVGLLDEAGIFERRLAPGDEQRRRVAHLPNVPPTPVRDGLAGAEAAVPRASVTHADWSTATGTVGFLALEMAAGAAFQQARRLVTVPVDDVHARAHGHSCCRQRGKGGEAQETLCLEPAPLPPHVRRLCVQVHQIGDISGTLAASGATSPPRAE